MRQPDPSDAPPDPQPLPTPEKKTPAKDLAYGASTRVAIAPNTYRMERGYPFIRAGQAVTASPQFKTLPLRAPVNQNALSSGLIDPSQPGFAQKGSNVPTFVTVAFTFNATSPTALTISWPATALRRANRTISNAFDTAIPSGSISLTGLTTSTAYWYYPYFSELAKTVGWAGAGNATSAGSPAIAQTAQSDAVLQSQSNQSFVPLQVLKFTQPASGTNSQTGGYASGNPDITGGGRSYKIFT